MVTYLDGGGDAQEVHKSNVLIPDDLHLVNETEATQVLPQCLLRETLIEITEVNVPASVALLDSESDRARDS